MKTLITGGAGALGTALASELGDAYVFDRHQLDVTSRPDVHRAIRAYRPDVVFHTGSISDAAMCERDPATAFAVNALGVRWMVEAADAIGARVVFGSVGNVFGSGCGPFSEWDPCVPMDVLGRSKHAGELELRPDDLLVRTGRADGRSRSALVRRVIKAGSSGRPIDLQGVDSVSVSFADDVAPLLVKLAQEGVGGAVHVSGGAPTDLDFGREVLTVAGFDPELAQQGQCSSTGVELACEVLPHLGLGELPPWRTSVERFLAKELATSS